MRLKHKLHCEVIFARLLPATVLVYANFERISCSLLHKAIGLRSEWEYIYRISETIRSENHHKYESLDEVFLFCHSVVVCDSFHGCYLPKVVFSIWAKPGSSELKSREKKFVGISNISFCVVQWLYFSFGYLLVSFSIPFSSLEF